MTSSPSSSVKSLVQLVKQKVSVATVKRFLSDNDSCPDVDRVNINEADCDGNNVTALYYACEDGNNDLVELLLAHPNIDPNAAGEYGDTPLTIASNDGRGKIVKLLLAHPMIDVNKRCVNGAVHSPLVAACTQGRLGVVKLLLARPDINVNMNAGEGKDDVDTALHAACTFGYVGIVTELLAHPDINVNIRDEHGRTPLFLACDNYRLSIIKLLLSRTDIDVNLTDSQGLTSINAVKKMHQNYVDNKLEFTAPGKRLHNIISALTADPRVSQNV